ncbi:uncharacterized protein SPSK_02510 [Sporothrix schenckii 1099-18]|uniref:Uncharacterized protein n=2 Tax=Sporothrix schenckii TaxID=29908 RepID=U7PLA8_SPOS1|nr:uncharacterized protein SPSK_02510 [Sporothrix schenckii 1099-18]ERS95504.1 hypothetical protein HMPREF1624_08020 [Sporothrix schenckii ATCC 58251]KJR86800.1 hypothetical protein SPSK_02510 [Sporothrix schenckii 1099-18]
MNGSDSSLQPTPPFSINILWPTSADGDANSGLLPSRKASPRSPPPPPPPLESYLPGVYRDESLPQLSTPSLTAAYLVTELGLGRLDGFSHHWFWLLGSPALPRPLHDCVHRGRTICVTERMDRHLGLGLGSDGGRGGGGGKRDLLYLKPLPRFLLDTRFWEQVLACECKRDDTVVVMSGRRSWISRRSGSNSNGSAQSSPPGSLRSQSQMQPHPQSQSQQQREQQRQQRAQSEKTVTSSASAASTSSSASSTCEKRHLWDCALGFLYSYAALVAHESDFRIAQEHGLLPAEVTWHSWRLLTRQVVTSPDVVAHRFHQRFLYGEMMLHRLREISQLKRGGLVPVLIGRLDRFARFFQGNVRWLASLMAYIAIVLSSLQAGLTTDRLAASSAFQSFASGFTMFSLIAPLSILLAFGGYFGLSLVYHVGVHLVTSHLYVGTARQAMIVDGVNAFQHHWGDSKSEV